MPDAVVRLNDIADLFTFVSGIREMKFCWTSPSCIQGWSPASQTFTDFPAIAG